LAGSDTDEALEVLREVTLVREAGVRGNLCQSEVAATLQELFGSPALEALGRVRESLFLNCRTP
jgi:hypothetical protein